MISALIGNNTYKRDQKLRELTQDGQNVERIAGEETSAGELIQSLSAASLFASESTVVVEDLSKNKGAIEKIDEILTASEQGNDLILIEASVDKRTSYYKTLKKKTNVVECEPLKDYDAVDFAQNYVKQLGGTISKADATTLVQRVGADQYALTNEVSKLLLTKQDIDKKHIERHTEQRPEDSTFALTDALVAGQVEPAVRIYRELRTAGQQPYEIMGSLGWQLQVLVLINSAPGRGERVIAKQTKLHPFVVKKNQSVASNVQLSQLKKAIAAALETDLLLKTSQADNDQLVENLLYELQHTLYRK